ncbi:hypothetical protein [Pseudophaeobacter flagellatus]|uniref:hypothetical protein n=1 Tax=Pseudophaeobacter flagellatus TaxID=2899119 RepID=UPI001E49C01D|nr:hypothetical protein [Pseudophaeobacter flagellatus]MCD9148520.1 hypothetical protein [Pseudophaeobacter flagellatus]
MIRSATMKLGKKTLKLKFSTRALIRIEAENGGQPFDTLLDQLITGTGGVTLMASALAAGLNDGKGIDQDQALDLIDQAGGVRKMLPLVGDAIGAAFNVKSAADEGGGADDLSDPSEAGEAGEAAPGKGNAAAEA